MKNFNLSVNFIINHHSKIYYINLTDYSKNFKRETRANSPTR